MVKNPSFPLYAQDFLTGVMYMKNDEIGMYIRMLCKQWTDGKIPKKRVGFLIGIEWSEVSEELRSKFEERGESLVNKRLEAELMKRADYKKRQAVNGKKGGRPKKSSTKTKPKSKPNKSQKKPLENENEKEKENKRGSGGKIEGVPDEFISGPLLAKWEVWKKYKKKEHGFNFKSDESQFATIKKLHRISGGNQKSAESIIQNSIENGWAGLFEIKKPKLNAARKETKIASEPSRGRKFGTI